MDRRVSEQTAYGCLQVLMGSRESELPGLVVVQDGVSVLGGHVAVLSNSSEVPEASGTQCRLSLFLLFFAACSHVAPDWLQT